MCYDNNNQWHIRRKQARIQGDMGSDSPPKSQKKKNFNGGTKEVSIIILKQ